MTLRALCITTLFAGCAAGPAFGPPAGPSALLAAAVDSPPLPPLLISKQVRLRYDNADIAELAGRSLEEVVGTIPRPDFLPAADAPPPTEPVDAASPPSAALRAYARGRDAYQRGDRFDAINQLEQAHRLDPRSPAVLRLLGEVYLARGDQARGTRRLEEAVKLDPDDPSTLFLLGRQAFREGRWEKAIATLGYTRSLLIARPTLLDESQRADPAIRYLLPYYLGLSLLQQGHDRAAADVLAPLIDTPVEYDRTSELLRELAVLNRRLNDLNVLVGDAMMRLGRAGEAYERYASAERPVSDEDAATLTARVLYSLLLLGRYDDAELALLGELALPDPDEELLSLTTYLADHSPDRAALFERLSGLYERRGRPSSLALAIAELHEPAEASRFLIDHLTRRPDDLVVYRAALELLAERPPSEAVTLALRVMRANPPAATRYAEVLLESDVGGDRDRLLKAIGGLDAGERESAAGQYLRGAVLESLGRLSEAAGAYDLALAADEAFVGSRMAVVNLHLRAGRDDRALEIIEQTPEPHTLEMRFARAHALGGLKRYAESEREVRGLLADLPRNPEYLIFLADLQAVQGNAQEAEATLLSIVDFDGTYEPAYAALFELYRSDTRRFSDTSSQRLLQRAQLNIPDSRTARFELAVWYMRNGRLEQAEPLLRGLVEREPDDFNAIQLLVTLLNGTDRKADASSLMVGLIDARPVEARRMAAYWQIIGGIDGPEADAPRIRLLDRLLERAGELPARQAADFHYLRASIFHRTGQMEEYRAAVGDALTADPDHPGANNDVGYQMVEENRDLPRALEMIRKAVAAEPDNAAYLDSLGWAHYKLGNFAEALEHLQRASELPGAGEDPVIHDHLADTLWRLNRTEEAIERWRDAQRRLAEQGLLLEADSAKLRDNLRAKVEAATENGRPPVAPTPDEAPPPTREPGIDRAEAAPAQPDAPGP